VSVLLVLVGLPLGVIAAAAFGAWRARRSPRLALRAFALGVPLALGAGLVYGFRFPVLVRQLTSSTAGLAYLGLPVAAVIVAAVALPFAWALSVLVIAAWRAQLPRAAADWTVVAGAVTVLIAGVAGVLSVSDFLRLDRTVRMPTATADELRAVYADYERHRRLYEAYASMLLRSGNNHVLARVAVHANAPEDVLVPLLSYPDHAVSQRAWRHRALTPETLRRLSVDATVRTRRGLASNARTPPDILRALAQDPALDSAMFQNEALPDDVAATVLPRLAAALTGPNSEYFRAAVGRQRKAPPELLESMSRDPMPVVREHVAFNPRTPVEALRRLAADPDATVRRGAAGNASTPPDVLRMLHSDPSEPVRSMARANRATPSD
jgi:hypothetical protein